MEHLIRLLTWKGQVVLDPFMGSGSTGVSCKQLKRGFYGFEIDSQYFGYAKRRITRISNKE